MSTLLIIDDRAVNRDYLAALLGYEGHRLLQAADGVEGLALARSEHPALVITDILMPTMDGSEFVRQLRADPTLAGTPVIFCTAHYHERAAQAVGRECGVSQVLTRSDRPEVILRAVEAALGEGAELVPTPVEEFDREHLRLLTEQLTSQAEELRSTNARLSAMVDLGVQLGSERDPARLLQAFCSAAREILGARRAVVGVLDATGTKLRYFITSGFDSTSAESQGYPPPGLGLLRRLVEEGGCIRQRQPVPGVDLPASFPPCRAFLGAALASPGRTYGWVCLLDKVGAAEFSAEDERLTGALATQGGRVYENSSLYAEALRQTRKLELEVAERKRVEADLRANEERFRSAFEDTHVAMVLTDLDNRFVRANGAFAKFFGYSVEEVLHLSMPDVTHPDSLGESLSGREQLLRGERQFFQTEKRYRHRNGETLWGLTNVSLVRDSSGQPLMYVGQVQDITERKRLEDEFHQAQERMQRVVASSPAVLYTLSTHGTTPQLTWISDNVPDLLGYTAAEALQPHWWEAGIHPEDVQQAQDELVENLYVNGRLANEFRFRNREGSYQWVRNEMRLLRNPAGRPVEIVGSWWDITERKHLEEQFRQAQKMDAIGQLAGGIAHDFNNMLAVINGYGDMIMGRLPEADKTRRLVAQMVAAGTRAAALTRQLLVFSRKAIVEPRLLDLREVVSEMDRMLRRIIGEDIQLTTLWDPDLGTVRADLSQIEQVLLNLVVNGRDAMPQGGQLTVELRHVDLDHEYVQEHPEAQAGRYVMLAVTDTGCGMDSTTLARAFEPFFTTKGDRGTGLGLATVYGIARQSGGHVGVYSEVGHGTTFKVYLPRVDNPVDSDLSPEGVEAIPSGTETVLLAEDEDAVRALARLILEECGYTVLEAAGGAEALRLAQEHAAPIHLLMTDVVMPQMSGRELAGQLQTLRPQTKVLYVSGYTDDAVVRHGILEAEVAFLPKPYSVAALARKVREVLDRA